MTAADKEEVMRPEEMDILEREYAAMRDATMEAAFERFRVAIINLGAELIEIIRPWMVIAYFVTVLVMLIVDSVRTW